MIRLCHFLIVAIISIPVWSVTPSFLQKGDVAARDRWVDSVYNSMSPRERIGQLFVPVVYFNGNSQYRDYIRQLVEEKHVGGLLFGHSTIANYASVINYSQSLADVPLLITLDGEWGLSMRLIDAPRYPQSVALGAGSDAYMLYEYGRRMAKECRAIGIHVNFAPVLDVNSNPDNPVIGYRSFGEDPEHVSRLANAYSQGLEDGGVLSVGKHFPGHGDTETDSHKSLPEVLHSRSRLDSIELYPFRKYIDAGLSGIMVAHLKVPALDPSGLPASLSRDIITGVLRDQLNFEGLIFTDALEMQGAKVEGINNCVQAFLAGADMLLASAAPLDDIEEFWNAYKSGQISESTIEQSCRKVLAYKHALNLHNENPIPLSGLMSEINSSEAIALNHRLSSAAITVLSNEKKLLPISEPKEKNIALVNIGKGGDFEKLCRRYAENITVYSITDALFTANEFEKIKSHDIVIAGVSSCENWAIDAFAQLSDIEDIIPVFIMNPFKMSKFSQSLQSLPTIVLTGDDTHYLREYAAKAIFGKISVNGRLPINLNGIAPIGAGVTLRKLQK